jgi:hypothetical protein
LDGLVLFLYILDEFQRKLSPIVLYRCDICSARGSHFEFVLAFVILSLVCYW